MTVETTLVPPFHGDGTARRGAAVVVEWHHMQFGGSKRQCSQNSSARGRWEEIRLWRHPSFSEIWRRHGLSRRQSSSFEKASRFSFVCGVPSHLGLQPGENWSFCWRGGLCKAPGRIFFIDEVLRDNKFQ